MGSSGFKGLTLQKHDKHYAVPQVRRQSLDDIHHRRRHQENSDPGSLVQFYWQNRRATSPNETATKPYHMHNMTRK